MFRIVRLLGLYGWCILAGLFTASLHVAHAQPIRSAIAPDVSVAEIEGLPFPKSLAGLTRQSKVDYRAPGLGFSVTYADPGRAWADIYIYDKQLKLPSGPALSLAKEELEMALGDVRAAVKSGAYQDARVIDRSASGSFAKSDLRITQGGTERSSSIFVTVHKGKFVKIRVTANIDAASSQSAQSVASEYEQILKKR
jgi:hypothetical protein